MLKLFLIRHGEAESPTTGQSDHSRPLTIRGTTDISALRTKVFEAGIEDLMIICSSALRTKSTAMLIGSNRGPEIREEPTLYSGDAATYIQAIRSHASSGKLALVGHNPVISWVAAELTGGRSGGFMPGTCVEITYEHDSSDPMLTPPVSVLIHHPER